jgi:hypothetical protein
MRVIIAGSRDLRVLQRILVLIWSGFRRFGPVQPGGLSPDCTTLRPAFQGTGNLDRAKTP